MMKVAKRGCCHETNCITVGEVTVPSKRNDESACTEVCATSPVLGENVDVEQNVDVGLSTDVDVVHAPEVSGVGGVGVACRVIGLMQHLAYCRGFDWEEVEEDKYLYAELHKDAFALWLQECELTTAELDDAMLDDYDDQCEIYPQMNNTSRVKTRRASHTYSSKTGLAPAKPCLSMDHKIRKRKCDKQESPEIELEDIMPRSSRTVISDLDEDAGLDEFYEFHDPKTDQMQANHFTGETLYHEPYPCSPPPTRESKLTLGEGVVPPPGVDIEELLSVKFAKDIVTESDNETAKGMMSDMRSAFQTVFNWVTSGFKVSYRQAKDFVLNDVLGKVVVGAARAYADVFIRKHLDTLVKLITTAFKFMFRCVTQMPPKFLLAETMMDIAELMGKVFCVDTDLIEAQTKPQDGQPSWHLPLTAVFATLLALFGSKKVDPMSFGVLWRSAGSLVGFIRGCADGVSGFSHLVFGYTPEKAFPRTLKFNEWLNSHIEKDSVTSFSRREGIRLYHGYLAERMEWSRLDMTNYFQTKCPLLFADHSHLTSAFPKFRMQPPAFVFEGDPGHGKTHLMNLVLNVLYKMFRAYGLIDATLGFRDFSYSWTPGKKHWDGYASQPVPVLNDFGQEFESASDVDAASTAFMNMVDSNPWFLSMAGMHDKGMCFDALCLLVSTMIPTSLWPTHFKKCAKPQAMLRRITKSWNIRARKFDAEQGVMIVDPDYAVDDQWIITDVKTQERVTIDEVAAIIFTSIMEAVEKYEKTFDKVGMMSTPTMDKAIQKFADGKYSYRCVPNLPTIDSINGGLRAEDHLIATTKSVTWWETTEMQIAKLILTLSGGRFKVGNVLRYLIGFGISLGFVMSYLHKDGILSWIGNISEKGKNMVKNTAASVVDSVSVAFPDHKINGVNYTHSKAQVNDHWVNVFVEDVEPQSKEIILQKMIPSQFKKRMIGKHFPEMKIEHGHVSCKNAQGEHSVWGIVVDTQHLIVVKHFFDTRDTFEFVTNASRMKYVVDKKHVRVHNFPDIDLVLIRMFDVTICNGRNILNRFPVDCSLLPAQQLQRLSVNGKENANVRSVSLTKSYGSIEGITCTSVTLAGYSGACGLIYLDYKGQIVGIHVAGNDSRSFFVTLSKARLQHAMASLCDVAPPVNLYGGAVPQMNDSVRVITGVGLSVAGASLGPYSPINRRSDLMKIPLKVNLPDDHEVANMGFFYDAEKRVPVETLRLKDWDVRMRHSISNVWEVDDQVIDSMAKSVMVRKKDKLVPWDQLAASSDGMPSITRTSSAGPWFPGQSKNLFCVEQEIPELNNTTLAHLQEYDALLQKGVGFPTISAMALKVERLPREKVVEGKTRVFQAGDALKYFIDRRYFGFLIAELHDVLKAQTGVCYAATPEQVGEKFSMLPDMLVATDISKQDNSHSRTSVVLMKFFLASGLLTNENPEFFVHPSLPKLSCDNRARFILLRDTGFGQRVYHNLVIDNCGGGLASGSLLTTLFNCIITWYGMEKVKMSYPTLKYVLFGDDVASNCLDFDLIRSTFDSIGFGVKGAGAGDVFIVEYKQDVIFCGRKYSPQHNRMNLTRDRLSKIIRFITLRNTETAYASSMMNFLSEAAYEPDYLDLVKSIEFRGTHLIEYLPLECLQSQNVLKESFWSSRDDPEDDMTMFEMFSLSMVLWLETSGVIDFIEMTLNPVLPQMDKGKEKEEVSDEVPDTVSAGDSTGGEMLSLVTTDVQDVSATGRSEKEPNYSFVPNEINQFWSRPVRIVTTSWRVTDAVDFRLANFRGFSDVIDAATNYQLKLANSVGIRGTLRVFVVVNATPFQAGGLVLYSSPNASHVETSVQAMTGPHAIVTAGANQTASIEMPYNRELLWCPTHAYSKQELTYFDWTRVGLRVLVPLVVAAGASTFANVQILVQLVDMEVMQGTVTDFAFSPQMGPQVEKDRAASSAGAFVKGVAGVTESVSKIAMAGMSLLSKASHTVSQEPLTYSVAHSIASYNGTDDSKTAALNASAHTVVHENLHPDSVDCPTSVVSIGARPGVVSFFEYTTLTQENAILSQWGVDPVASYGSVDLYNTKPPLAYLASHFLFWRGTMTYRFTLFKTAFHSGTLEILVDYGGPSVSPNTSSRSINLHRVYWDITTQSTITVSIPYRRPWHWCQFGNNNYAPLLSIVAIQPLVAGDNVSQTITVMVEQYSPDFQVAWPQRCSNFDGEGPRSVVGLPLPSPYDDDEGNTIHPQMFGAWSKLVSGSDSKKQGNFDPAITTHDMAEHVLLGDPSPQPSTDDFAYKYIAGEEVTDILQVLKRFHPLGRESDVPIPSEFIYTQNLQTDLTHINIGSWPLYCESLSRLFVYGTGGYRLKVVSQEMNHFATARVYLPTEVDGTFSTNISPGIPTIYQNSLNRPSLEIEVPNVTQFFYYRLRTEHEGTQTGNRPNLATEVTYSSSAALGLWFAFADDVTWGGQNYLPPIAIQLPTLVYNPSTLGG